MVFRYSISFQIWPYFKRIHVSFRGKLEKSRKKWCFEASAEDPQVCIDHDFRILLDEEDDPKVRTSLAGEFFRIQDTHFVDPFIERNNGG